MQNRSRSGGGSGKFDKDLVGQGSDEMESIPDNRDTNEVRAGQWTDNQGHDCRGTEVVKTYVHVLTNSPNSCQSERLFSIFNTTYNDDQKSSYADYIELSIQSQFNKRPL